MNMLQLATISYVFAIERIWRLMVLRCEKGNEDRFPTYAGRGIRICAEWRRDFYSFCNWALSHGYHPNLTIDRIDNDGDYEPGNCQWITRSKNSQKAFIDRPGKRHIGSRKPRHFLSSPGGAS